MQRSAGSAVLIVSPVPFPRPLIGSVRHPVSRNERGSKMMEKIQKWATLGGVISAAVALLTLAINVAAVRRDFQKAQINEWQEVTVYSTILDAKLEGLTFDDIQRNYTIKAKDLPEELPRPEIQTQALKRILLTLIAKRAISMRSDGKYVFAIDPVAPGEVPLVDAAIRMEAVGGAIIDLVSKQPGRYTPQEISELLKGRFRFSDVEFQRLLVNMREGKHIRIDKQGKVWLPN